MRKIGTLGDVRNLFHMTGGQNDSSQSELFGMWTTYYSNIFSSNRNAHIVTIWGAEYNARGEVKALSTTDSDDRVSRMTGVNVKVRGNEIRLSNNTKNFNFGPRVYDLYTLDLGTKHWENYFKTQGGN